MTQVIERTKTFLFYTANTMDADVLATQGARASEFIIFTMLKRNNSALYVKDYQKTSYASPIYWHTGLNLSIHYI